MSKGSPRVTIRIPQRLLDQVSEVIARSHTTRRDGPFDESEFARIAIVEKLKKMERGRKKYGKRVRREEPIGYQVEVENEFNAFGQAVSGIIDTDAPRIV